MSDLEPFVAFVSFAAATLLRNRKNSIPSDVSEVIFLGTGSSSGSPNPWFIMAPLCMDERGMDKALKAKVANCKKGIIGDPRYNKDYRCNPSLCIKFRSSDGGDGDDDAAVTGNNAHEMGKDRKNKDKGNGAVKTVIIDVGKHFRESILRWFPLYNMSSVDAIVLTHAHADAIFGLDDLRSVVPRDAPPLKVCLDEDCKAVVKQMFFYLFPDAPNPQKLQKTTAAADKPIVRHVSSVDWTTIEGLKEFEPVPGLLMQPIPVMHGEDLICMGYMFGKRDVVLYLSDISRMLPESMAVIKARGTITLLIIDALRIEETYITHYSLRDAVALARELRPTRTLCIGMSQEFDHEEVNASLAKLWREEALDVQLAYDGQMLPMRL
jgi:phosphoribosyl 1,2-cyclic phosphodiesterase